MKDASCAPGMSTPSRFHWRLSGPAPVTVAISVVEVPSHCSTDAGESIVIIGGMPTFTTASALVAFPQSFTTKTL